jgi:hypothetical protein
MEKLLKQVRRRSSLSTFVAQIFQLGVEVPDTGDEPEVDIVQLGSRGDLLRNDTDDFLGLEVKMQRMHLGKPGKPLFGKSR